MTTEKGGGVCAGRGMLMKMKAKRGDEGGGSSLLAMEVGSSAT
jgi:hypothetical protein